MNAIARNVDFTNQKQSEALMKSLNRNFRNYKKLISSLELKNRQGLLTLIFSTLDDIFSQYSFNRTPRQLDLLEKFYHTISSMLEFNYGDFEDEITKSLLKLREKIDTLNTVAACRGNIGSLSNLALDEKEEKRIPTSVIEKMAEVLNLNKEDDRIYQHVIRRLKKIENVDQYMEYREIVRQTGDEKAIEQFEKLSEILYQPEKFTSHRKILLEFSARVDILIKKQESKDTSILPSDLKPEEIRAFQEMVLKGMDYTKIEAFIKSREVIEEENDLVTPYFLGLLLQTKVKAFLANETEAMTHYTLVFELLKKYVNFDSKRSIFPFSNICFALIEEVDKDPKINELLKAKVGKMLFETYLDVVRNDEFKREYEIKKLKNKYKMPMQPGEMDEDYEESVSYEWSFDKIWMKNSNNQSVIKTLGFVSPITKRMVSFSYEVLPNGNVLVGYFEPNAVAVMPFASEDEVAAFKRGQTKIIKIPRRYSIDYKHTKFTMVPKSLKRTYQFKKEETKKALGHFFEVAFDGTVVDERIEACLVTIDDVVREKNFDELSLIDEADVAESVNNLINAAVSIRANYDNSLVKSEAYNDYFNDDNEISDMISFFESYHLDSTLYNAALSSLPYIVPYKIDEDAYGLIPQADATDDLTHLVSNAEGYKVLETTIGLHDVANLRLYGNPIDKYAVYLNQLLMLTYANLRKEQEQYYENATTLLPVEKANLLEEMEKIKWEFDPISENRRARMYKRIVEIEKILESLKEDKPLLDPLERDALITDLKKRVRYLTSRKVLDLLYEDGLNACLDKTIKRGKIKS